MPPTCRCHCRAGGGLPVTTTVNVAGWPATTVRLTGAVTIVGAEPVSTVRLKAWSAVAEPLLAVRVNVSGEPATDDGVPDTVAVLVPATCVSVAQLGKVPEVTVRELSAGVARVEIVYEPNNPAAKVAAGALVKTGLSRTASGAVLEYADKPAAFATNNRNKSPS